MTTDTVFATITVKVRDEEGAPDAQDVWTDFLLTAFNKYKDDPKSCPVIGVTVQKNPPTPDEAAENIENHLSLWTSFFGVIG